MFFSSLYKKKKNLNVFCICGSFFFLKVDIFSIRIVSVTLEQSQRSIESWSNKLLVVFFMEFVNNSKKKKKKHNCFTSCFYNCKIKCLFFKRI